MRQALRALLATALIGAFVLSGILIAVCGEHECAAVVCACPENDCPHSGCDICEAIAAGRRIFAAVLMAAVGMLWTAYACVCFLYIKNQYRYAPQTPVKLKTMLLC